MQGCAGRIRGYLCALCAAPLLCVPALAAVDRCDNAIRLEAVSGDSIALARERALLVSLAGVDVGDVVRVVQGNIDVRWLFLRSGHASDAVVDAPTMSAGSELAVAPADNPIICVWSEDTEHPAGRIRIEHQRFVDPALRQAMRARAAADRDAPVKTAQQRRKEYLHAASLLETAGRNELAAEAFLASGMIAKWNNMPIEAKQDFAAAVARADRAKSAELSGWARHWLGSVMTASGDFGAARAVFERALKSGSSISPDLRAALQIYAGLMHHSQGELQAAARWYEMSLDTLDGIDSPVRRAMALNNLAGLHYQQGEAHRAAPLFDDVVRAYESMGNRMIIEGLTNAGRAYTALGEFETAIARLDRAISSKPDAGYSRGGVLEALGRAFFGLGDWKRAEESFSAALADAELTADVTMRARLQRELGRLAMITGDTRGGTEILAAALKAFSGAEALAEETGTGCDLARAYLANGQTDEVARLLPQLERRLPALEAQRLVAQQGCLREVHGQLAMRAGDPQLARRYLDKAAMLYDAGGLGVRLLEVRALLAALALQDGRTAEALAILDQASSEASAVLERLTRGAQRRSYLDATRRLLDLRVQALMDPDSGDLYAAFEASAAARAPLLRSTFHDVRANPARSGQEANSRARLAGLLSRKTQLLESGASSSELAGLLLDIASAEWDVDGADSATKLSRHAIAGLAAVQAQLNDRQLLLHYHLGDSRGWLWTVSADDASVYDMPGNAELAPLVAELRRHWGAPSRDANAEHEVAHAIADRLFGQLSDRLRDRELILVPDRSLHLLPFTGLPLLIDGRRIPLIQVSTSTRVAWPGGATRRRTSYQSAAVFATPGEGDLVAINAAMRSAAADARVFEGLSGSAREIDAIVAAFGADSVAIEIENLTSTAFRDLAVRPAGILHVSAHAYVHPFEPDLSAIVLNPDSAAGDSRSARLTALEVAALPLSQGLVVLSACETGVGPVSPTEGPVSLAHAFLAAGAENVIATLWQIPDAAAARFGELFYQALTRDESTAATALQAAQLGMLNERRWRDPYFWAGFTLTSVPATDPSPHH